MEREQHLEKFYQLLTEMKQFVKPNREKTVFSIGGRGHYENPISDVLAFFLDPNEEHGLGTLFLTSFMRVLNVNREGLENVWIEREVFTDEGNRIDLVIQSEDWVLVIENKIYHTLLNPLRDYEYFITTKYPNKEPLYAILSINETSATWGSVLYRDYIMEIKKQAGLFMFQSNNPKWSFFLKDFILNIEELIGDNEVNQDMIDFVQENYQSILELIEVKDRYIASLGKIFCTLLHEKEEYKVHNWSKRVAIRFYLPEKWGKKTNLVLVIQQDGNFKIYYYIYGIEAEQREEESVRLGLSGYQHWKENREMILCYKSESSFDLDRAKEEFMKAAKHLNESLFYNEKTS